MTFVPGFTTQGDRCWFEPWCRCSSCRRYNPFDVPELRSKDPEVEKRRAAERAKWGMQPPPSYTDYYDQWNSAE